MIKLFLYSVKNAKEAVANGLGLRELYMMLFIALRLQKLTRDPFGRR